MNLKKFFSVLVSAAVFGNPLTGIYAVQNVSAENADIKNMEITDMSVEAQILSAT